MDSSIERASPLSVVQRKFLRQTFKDLKMVDGKTFVAPTKDELTALRKRHRESTINS